MSKYINWRLSDSENSYDRTKINHNKTTVIIWDFKWDQKWSLTTSLDTPQSKHQSMPNAGVYSIVHTITTLSQLRTKWGEQGSGNTKHKLATVYIFTVKGIYII